MDRWVLCTEHSKAKLEMVEDSWDFSLVDLGMQLCRIVGFSILRKYNSVPFNFTDVWEGRVFSTLQW